MDNDDQFKSALRREACARTADLELPEPEKLDPDAPAPRLQKLVNEYGSGPCARALMAWQRRMMGDSIIEVARQVGLPIESAKELLREVHEAVAEDLKENLDLNRSLDLGANRLDYRRAPAEGPGGQDQIIAAGFTMPRTSGETYWDRAAPCADA